MSKVLKSLQEKMGGDTVQINFRKGGKALVLLCAVLCRLSATSQEHLSLEDALAKAMKHNFDINIAGYAAEQSARNNTLGNAGFSPVVILSASASASRSNTHNDLANGTTQSNPHAQSTNFNPGLQAAWTLYDGGKMFIVKKQLEELEALGGVQLKAQIQTVVSRTIQMYAQLVWQNKQSKAINTALDLAKVRMQISQLKYETGAGAKVDFLQARVDYNARQSDSLNQVASFTLAQDSLAVLMGENEDKNYVPDDSLVVNPNLRPADKSLLEERNLSVAITRYNARISGLNADIAQTYFLPNLAFSGGYSFSKTSNSTGFALFSQSYGPNGMFTLSLPVFEGGNLRRQSRVASLQAMRDQLLYERQNTVVGRQYRTAWKNYEVAVAAYKFEHENISFAKENLDVQLARFKVGVGTTLESRQAENDYVTALERLYLANYNLKVTETIVLEMENQLVK